MWNNEVDADGCLKTAGVLAIANRRSDWENSWKKNSSRRCSKGFKGQSSGLSRIDSNKRPEGGARRMKEQGRGRLGVKLAG